MTRSHRSLSKAEFAARVDGWLEAATRAGTTSFASLLRGLPGVYPTELLSSIGRLHLRGSIDPAIAATVRQQAKAHVANTPEGRSLLPLPHPLDFEWRFTPDASRTLLDQAAALTPAGGDLLLFGTPGLALEALTLPIGRRTALLAEANSVTDRLLSLNTAIGSPLNIAFCSAGLPRESADAVLLDPPWYPDFVRPMLAAAAHACRLGGVVLISLPPDGARPGAETDRHATIAFGQRLGLTLSDYCPLAISYETPFFERNALAAAGVVTPPRWRRGDLMVFRKSGPPARPPLTPAYTRIWTEVSIERMRVFIRNVPDAHRSPCGLIPLVEGDILPTVSRRDPRRRMADVWTSGNRIFRTDNPQLVLEAALLCAGDAMGYGVQPRLWGTLRERETVELVAAELRELAVIEAAEEGGAPRQESKRSAVWKLSSTSYCTKSTATLSG